jgi:hypothetical protein
VQSEQINRISSRVAIGLSGTALLAVLSGYFQPPQTDEGSAAHIFQLSLVMLVTTVLLLLGTTDWKQPGRTLRAIATAAVILLIAFGALYYLEHYRF